MIGFILDHLWQSTLFSAVAGLLTLTLRDNAAQIRYYLWFVASVKFLVPFAGLAAAGSYLLASLMSPVSAPRLLLLKTMAQPFSAETLTVSAMPVPGLDLAQIVTPLLLVLWAVGFVAITARWLLRWSRLQRVLHGAVDCPMLAPVPVKMAPSMLEPGLVGIWRPVILLPQGITERLSQGEMDAIMAHELCHLRRRDNLLAATHMLVEAVFWFHPLIWWLGARLNTEREHACDETVLAQGQSPQVYAESILKVCQFYLHSPLDCAAGISGADLKIRMETIVENKFSLRLNAAKKLLLAGCAAAVIAAPIAVGLLTAPPVLAQTAATRTTRDPRTDAALRQQIGAWQKHQPAMMHLFPSMTTQQLAEIQKEFDAWGALKSVTFKGVEDFGADGRDSGTAVYAVEFANARTTWMIRMTPDGKVGYLLFNPAIERSNPKGPEPGTEAALRRFIDGFSKGQPAYDVLVPDMAQSEWKNNGLAGFEKQLRPLGALKSLTFQKVTFEGLDQFEAMYEHGRATWSVGPLNAGKIENYGFVVADPQHPGLTRGVKVRD